VLSKRSMRFATVKAFQSIECGLITQVARTPRRSGGCVSRIWAGVRDPL